MSFLICSNSQFWDVKKKLWTSSVVACRFLADLSCLVSQFLEFHCFLRKCSNERGCFDLKLTLHKSVIPGVRCKKRNSAYKQTTLASKCLCNSDGLSAVSASGFGTLASGWLFIVLCAGQSSLVWCVVLLFCGANLLGAGHLVTLWGWQWRALSKHAGISLAAPNS